ncbi:hypothetical protein [Nocardioides sp. KR10-350]
MRVTKADLSLLGSGWRKQNDVIQRRRAERAFDSYETFTIVSLTE